MTERHAKLEEFASRLRTFLLGPQLLAFLPAATLAAFWLGGETALVATALAVPALFAISGHYPSTRHQAIDPATGLRLRHAAVEIAERLIAHGSDRAETTAALAVGIDDFAEITQRLDPRAAGAVLAACANRIVGAVRTGDVVVRLEGPRLAVVLAPGTRADLESLIQIASRFQSELEDPVIVDGARIYVSVSVGFCAARTAPQKSGEALVAAAEHALTDALAHGAGSIRAFAPDMQKRAEQKIALTDELPAALDREEIRPWFQPQVSMKTGEITGFEVLARWEHPKLGIVPPVQFLGAIEELGMMDRLGEVMLYQALGALRGWDSAGVRVPGLSLNFSGDELRNPKLVEKIRWELDRFNIAPERITVEILETVIADSSNDVIARNLRALSDLGCQIDLDDFGTGHASITNIKRFRVDRIKIDRSFVTQLDTDSEQQKIVGAILTMAGRLGLKTLAEGVETPGENATLRTLGCDFVQGFGIARPMPSTDVAGWIAGYGKRLETRDQATAEAVPRPATGLRSPAGKTA